MLPKLNNLFAKKPFSSSSSASSGSNGHYYLSVVISLASVETAVWEMLTDGGGGYNLLSHSHKDLKDLADLSDLVIKAIDEAGSEAGVDFEDAVFGLPNSWIEKEEILPTHEKLVNKLCKDLEIEPIALVPIDSAVSYFLASKLGGPITANLIEIGTSKISVSVIHSGTVKYSQELKKTSDIPQTVFNLFTNSKSENLPARFIIFGANSSDELAEIENDFNNFNWLQKDGDYSAFLHIPKVTAVTEFSLAEAVAMSTASDFAAQDEFLGASQKVESDTDKTIDASPLPDEPQIVTPFPQDEQDDENAFGFVQEADIASASDTPQTTEPEPGEPTHALPAKELHAPTQPEPQPAPSLPDSQPHPKHKKAKVSFNVLAPLLNLSLVKRHRPVFFTILASFILLGLVVLYLIVPQADITLKVKTQNFDSRFVITAQTSSQSVDTASRTIPAQNVSIEENGEGKTVATGSKTVGERAKGTVTVYNKSDSLRTIPKGSIMTVSGLSFTLDSDVSIASQSAGVEGSTYGKTDAQATAASVGTDSNIGADKDLKFSNFDFNLVSARSKGAFSGGSSRQITVFSEDDSKRLKSQVENQILDQAVAKIQSQNPSTQILKSALVTKILSEKYSAAIGDEATTVDYSQKASFSALVYNTEDLNNLSYELIQKSIPAGYEIRKDDIKIDPVVKNSANNKLEIELNLSTKVFAKVDTNDIAKNIRGKSSKVVDNYLNSFPNVVSSQFRLIPPLPDFLKTAPTNLKQIKITVLPE